MRFTSYVKLSKIRVEIKFFFRPEKSKIVGIAKEKDGICEAPYALPVVEE